jgi:hypothetical protein
MPADSNRHAPRRVGATLALALAAAVGLAGCGTQLLYNRLDTVLHLYVSTQVSLQDSQSVGLRTALRGLLDWHRRSEMPRYAQFVEALAADAAVPLGRERIDRARLDVEALWRDSVARGAPEAARWLAQLQPRQLDELFASLGEDDADLREEYCDASEAERRREREKSLRSSIEDWVGSLDVAQRAMVSERYARLAPTGCGWVENRIRLRDELRDTIERRDTFADYPGTLTWLMLRPEQRWDAAYRASFDANREVIVELLGDLDATLDARQRRRLVQKLEGFARDFRELAGGASRLREAQAAR